MNFARVEEMWCQSETVLQDCALPNGAIVAANSDLAVYPASGENYRYVWGRDNAFQLVAASILKLPRASDIRANYLKWLNERAEGFSERGLIIKRYGTNGNLDWRYGTEYQPDQAGALLWALTETQDCPDRLTDNTIKLLANGLANEWDGRSFRTLTQDLWENRSTQPHLQDVFTYSLAATAHGLERAVKQLRGVTGEVDEWEAAALGMRAILENANGGEVHVRKIYAKAEFDPDNGLDASLNGLVYPFDGINGEVSQRSINTVAAIGQKLCQLPDGIARYEGDTYDGIVRPGGGEAIAGRWPLLTFWQAIALNRTGQPQAARQLFEATIDHLDDLYKTKALPENLIPEQLFPDERQGRAILPLAWSHAMFVIAASELELI